MRRSILLLAAFGIGTSVVGLLGQAPSDKIPAIEVASVKPNTTNNTRIHGAYSPSGLLTMTNYSVRTLIEWAFAPVPWSRISGGPTRIEADRFDIVARVEGPQPTVAQLRAMLRSLLIERFKLVTHTERREGTVYELVRAHSDGRLGTRMRPVPVDCSLDANYQLPPPCRATALWPGLITGGAVTMQILCDTLRDALNDHRDVLDRTGLTGTFAVDLKFRPDQIPPPDAVDSPDFAKAVAAIDPNGPSLFTAVEEQLGLKLKPEKESIDFVVIDHVEKPTPD